MLKKIIPIYIHCWGGLGSQLYAWALYLDIERKFPKRRINLVLHSSGVTQRLPEHLFSNKKDNLISKDDFKYGQEIYNGKSPFFMSSKIFLKRISKLLGIFAEANTTNEFEILKPTLIAVRGHYSQRKISDYSLQEIIRELKNHESSQEKNLILHSNTALHYRLGDLLTDGIKNYMSPEHMRNFVNEISKIWNISTIDVYSDSPTSVKNMLINLDLEINVKDTGPINVICSATKYKYFIGTNSKITIWIILIRLFNDIESYNAIPFQMKGEIEIFYPNIMTFRNFVYF